MHDVVTWGDVEAYLFMTPLKITRLKCESSIRYERKLQFSSNSSKIGLSSVTHRVSTEMEELDVQYLPVYNAHPCIICTPISGLYFRKKKEAKKQGKWLRKIA